MAAAYTCDICNKPIPHAELGALSVRGVDPLIKGRRGKYFSEKLDLCSPCAKGAMRAVKALAAGD